MTITVLAQIAPQRSTQYATLASALAAPELILSPLGSQMTNLCPIVLGGQEYLRFDFPACLDEDQCYELGTLATCRAYFYCHDRIGEHQGPFLHPIETGFYPSLPVDLVMTRRYRGKTNEMFTQFLCNLARFSSTYATIPWTQLRLLDPLAGGATTLFAALILGASAAGVEQNRNDVQTTASFMQNYLREQRIHHTIKAEKLKKLGQRWTITIRGNNGKAGTSGKQRATNWAKGENPGNRTKKNPIEQRCIMTAGDTILSNRLIQDFRPHFIVSDLPYGIQHQGKLSALLQNAIPVWSQLLLKGGTMAFAWDSTRFERTHMIELVERSGPVQVLTQSPYDKLAHRVDRVIKQRDVIVVQKII
ncbi:hypothetical protein KFU94_17690 [Chloroflexi bacterium TSY]|nr:hypothetical protein [Chloroflexi bacterium TSY]